MGQLPHSTQPMRSVYSMYFLFETAFKGLDLSFCRITGVSLSYSSSPQLGRTPLGLSATATLASPTGFAFAFASRYICEVHSTTWSSNSPQNPLDHGDAKATYMRGVGCLNSFLSLSVITPTVSVILDDLYQMTGISKGLILVATLRLKKILTLIGR